MSTTTSPNGGADESAAPGSDWMGSMAATVEVLGDIVGPTSDLVVWDVLG